jgi:hypothetical protein
VAALNRKPKTMSDALVLIKQLKEEIVRRPRLVTVNMDNSYPLSISNEDFSKLTKGTLRISVYYRDEAWVFESLKYASSRTVVEYPYVPENEENIIPTGVKVPVNLEE